MRSRRSASDRGFSLVELMVVVAILGILVTIAVATFYLATDRSKRITCVHNQRALQSAMAIYQAQNNGDLPPNTTVGDLRPYVNWPSVNYGRCTLSTPSDPRDFYIEDGGVKCPTPGHRP